METIKVKVRKITNPEGATRATLRGENNLFYNTFKPKDLKDVHEGDLVEIEYTVKDDLWNNILKVTVLEKDPNYAPEKVDEPELIKLSEAGEWHSYFEELMTLGVPPEQAGPAASTIFIQRHKR